MIAHIINRVKPRIANTTAIAKVLLINMLPFQSSMFSRTYHVASQKKGLLRLLLAITLGFEIAGRFCYGIKIVASSHFYMCWVQYSENYRDFLTHTLDHQLSVVLKVLFLCKLIFLKITLVELMIPLYLKNCQWFLCGVQDTLWS